MWNIKFSIERWRNYDSDTLVTKNPYLNKQKDYSHMSEIFNIKPRIESLLIELYLWLNQIILIS